ncbi:unnamed protein product [Clonostachys byssicola]|uniref:Uncharacterized protein n=1 Tax=Clonostachys byssicola TaxID=160290 RepID=A0A9N9U2K5_9HYPO|nr:unnamed protein product [Clonostachys byssicola]
MLDPPSGQDSDSDTQSNILIRSLAGLSGKHSGMLLLQKAGRNRELYAQTDNMKAAQSLPQKIHPQKQTHPRKQTCPKKQTHLRQFLSKVMT